MAEGRTTLASAGKTRAGSVLENREVLVEMETGGTLD